MGIVDLCGMRPELGLVPPRGSSCGSWLRLQVFDSCGMAGGGPKQQPGEAKYTETKFAHQGDLGTKVLPPAPSGIVWARGSNVTTKWSIRTNHGGG